MLLSDAPLITLASLPVYQPPAPPTLTAGSCIPPWIGLGFWHGFSVALTVGTLLKSFHTTFCIEDQL